MLLKSKLPNKMPSERFLFHPSVLTPPLIATSIQFLLSSSRLIFIHHINRYISTVTFPSFSAQKVAWFTYYSLSFFTHSMGWGHSSSAHDVLPHCCCKAAGLALCRKYHGQFCQAPVAGPRVAYGVATTNLPQ